MKRNSCCLKVIGYRDIYPDWENRPSDHPFRPKSLRGHSSSRPDYTQTRPLKDWVVLHYQPMKAIRDHLLLGCPCCQPGAVMRMFLERVMSHGRCRPNQDVLNLARWIAEGRPTRVTRQVYKQMLALKAVEHVQRS